MKRFAILIAVAIVVLLFSAHAAEAQWVRRYYQPVFVTPQPVTRVYRRPVVMYQPTTVVYSRRRPILGGTVVHTRPAYRRTVVW
jgi:hypothetical protein